MEIVKQDAMQIESILSDNVEQAVDKLLKFTQNYSSDIQLKKRALKLNWDIEGVKNTGNSIENKKFLAVKEETVQILQKVLLDIEGKSELFENKIEKKKALRNIFLSEFPEDRVVFTGKDISYRYGTDGFNLEPFDITLNLGEITAIVGANSSGKSTLIKVVAGEHSVQSGEIHYPLFDKNNEKDWLLIKEQVAYVPQRLNKWDGLIKDYLSFTATTKGLRGQENIDEVQYIVERLGLSDFLDKKWSELSGGIQMRFELARALVWKPKLIILDEPLANLDIKTQENFLRDLYDLAHSHKNPISILITSQHLHEIENISDRSIFLNNGKVLYNDLTANIGDERIQNTYEINITGSLNDIRLALMKHGITNVLRKGNYIEVLTDRSLNASKVLNILTEPTNNFDVTYFRDISKSTKTMFE